MYVQCTMCIQCQVQHHDVSTLMESCLYVCVPFSHHSDRKLFYFPGLVNWSVLENKKSTCLASYMRPLSAPLRWATHLSTLLCRAPLRFVPLRGSASRSAPLFCSAVPRNAPTVPPCFASLRSALVLRTAPTAPRCCAYRSHCSALLRLPLPPLRRFGRIHCRPGINPGLQC